MPYEQHRARFTVSDDPARLDLDAVCHFLQHEAYWATDLPRATIEQSIRHALCFGLYDGDAQIGFARVVTDAARFAYLSDVYVLDAYRRQGLGTWLMACVLEHPALRTVRRFMLATHDAHGLYRRFGFVPLAHPERYMERAFSPD